MVESFRNPVAQTRPTRQQVTSQNACFAQKQPTYQSISRFAPEKGGNIDFGNLHPFSQQSPHQQIFHSNQTPGLRPQSSTGEQLSYANSGAIAPHNDPLGVPVLSVRPPRYPTNPKKRSRPDRKDWYEYISAGDDAYELLNPKPTTFAWEATIQSRHMQSQQTEMFLTARQFSRSNEHQQYTEKRLWETGNKDNDVCKCQKLQQQPLPNQNFMSYRNHSPPPDAPSSRYNAAESQLPPTVFCHPANANLRLWEDQQSHVCLDQVWQQHTPKPKGFPLSDKRRKNDIFTSPGIRRPLLIADITLPQANTRDFGMKEPSAEENKVSKELGDKGRLFAEQAAKNKKLSWVDRALAASAAKAAQALQAKIEQEQSPPATISPLDNISWMTSPPSCYSPPSISSDSKPVYKVDKRRKTNRPYTERDTAYLPAKEAQTKAKNAAYWDKKDSQAKAQDAWNVEGEQMASNVPTQRGGRDKGFGVSIQEALEQSAAAESPNV